MFGEAIGNAIYSEFLEKDDHFDPALIDAMKDFCREQKRLNAPAMCGIAKIVHLYPDHMTIFGVLADEDYWSKQLGYLGVEPIAGINFIKQLAGAVFFNLSVDAQQRNPNLFNTDNMDYLCLAAEYGSLDGLLHLRDELCHRRKEGDAARFLEWSGSFIASAKNFYSVGYYVLACYYRSLAFFIKEDERNPRVVEVECAINLSIGRRLWGDVELSDQNTALSSNFDRYIPNGFGQLKDSFNDLSSQLDALLKSDTSVVMQQSKQRVDEAVISVKRSLRVQESRVSVERCFFLPV